MLKAIPGDGEAHNAPPPALDERFLIKIRDKEFVTYAGLLDLAHQHGLERLEVELLQMPGPDNNMECICRATAVTGSGMAFSDIGDANPKNTSKKVVLHLIRMASTRAKARVLRDMTNIGMTALEELGDDAGEIPGCHGGNGGSGKAAPRPVAAGRKVPPKTGKDFKPITEAQKRAIANLARRKGYGNQKLNRLAREAFGADVQGLSSEDAAAFIMQLQKPDEFQETEKTR